MLLDPREHVKPRVGGRFVDVPAHLLITEEGTDGFEVRSHSSFPDHFLGLHEADRWDMKNHVTASGAFVQRNSIRVTGKAGRYGALSLAIVCSIRFFSAGSFTSDSALV